MKQITKCLLTGKTMKPVYFKVLKTRSISVLYYVWY